MLCYVMLMMQENDHHPDSPCNVYENSRENSGKES